LLHDLKKQNDFLKKVHVKFTMWSSHFVARERGRFLKLFIKAMHFIKILFIFSFIYKIINYTNYNN
jgi:hypothetical protein